MQRSALVAGVLAAVGLVTAGCAAGAASAGGAGAAGGSSHASHAVLTAAGVSAASTGVPGGTITATGNGLAEGPPDTLNLVVGVQNSGTNAQSVMDTNNREAAVLVAKLEADGVAAKDIQTEQLSVTPNYSQTSPPVIQSYTAADTVIAKVHQLNRAGTVIDDAVAAGGRDAQLQAVYYSLQNDLALQSAARADAVHKAQAEAQAMAAAAGVTLGPARSATDISGPQVSYGFPSAALPEAASGATGGAASGAAPVQPGSEQVMQQVSVVYEVA
jgi:hypothetical protein